LIAATFRNTGVNLGSRRQSLLASYRRDRNRGRIVQLVIDNQLVQKAEYNGAVVLMQYFGHLQRDPDESGYAFWLDALNHQEPVDVRGIVRAFLTSSEYQERFGGMASRGGNECGSRAKSALK